MEGRGGHIATFVLQSICIAIAFIAACFTVIDEGALFIILIDMFFIGILQLIIGFVNLAGFSKMRNQHRKMYRVYWIIVIAYAVGGIAIAFINEMRIFGRDFEFIGIVYLFAAWAIAVYHYIITWKQAFDKVQPPMHPGIDMPGFYDQR